jgi:hypothetical protein
MIIQAADTQVGDIVCFDNPKFNYTIEGLDVTVVGFIRHRFNDDTASASYAPGEWVNVERIAK